MSSRALRKLQGDQELEIIAGNTNEDESEENEEILVVSKSKKKRTPLNPFELVNHSCENSSVIGTFIGLKY